MGSSAGSRKPDFIQPDKPADVSEGMLWLRNDTDKFSMADGVDYWGSTDYGGIKGFVYGNKYPVHNVIQSIDFADETTAQESLTLSFSTYHNLALSDFSNSKIYVYKAHNLGTNYTDIFRHDPVAETLSASAVANRTYSDTLFGDVLYPGGGYGYTLGGQAPVSSVDKLTFSTESTSSVTSMPFAGYVRSVSSYTHGYVTGFNTAASPNPNEGQICKVQFSDESWTTLSSQTGTSYAYCGGLSKFDEKGLWCSGFNASTAGTTSQIRRMTFSTDANTVITSTMPTSNYGGDSFSTGKDGVGYVVGRITSINGVNKVTYSTEIASALASTFPQTVNNSAGDSGEY